MGTPAHWVEAAQGIWLAVHGHADRKETHTTINLYTSTQKGYMGEFTHSGILQTDSLFDKTNRINQDG